jgi:small conductance mechanosensitive channel
MDLINVAIILIASFIITKGDMYIVKRCGSQFCFEPTLIQVLDEIIKYFMIIVAITLVLTEFDMDVSAIVLSLGIAGVAVGFAARDTLSNFISGIFILADKRFKVGDIIEMSSQKGKVINWVFGLPPLKLRITKLSPYQTPLSLKRSWKLYCSGNS